MWKNFWGGIDLRKKKVLVHGTAESLHKFFSDAVSRDYEIVALLSDKPDKISSDLEIFTPQSLPKFIYGLIDGIIFTDASTKENVVNFFLKQKLPPRKVILKTGEEDFFIVQSRGSEVVFMDGLTFHLRTQENKDFFSYVYNILQNQRQVKNLSPQDYPEVLAQNWQYYTGKPLNLNNPKTFTEKLQWLKIFDATPLKSRLTDKYLVRNWIKEKIGGEYLIPLLGVWNDFDEINFDDLPDRFVLKCNHGSGMNIIVRDKKSFDKQQAREKINAWLAIDYSASFFELHYTRIERKILAEKYIENMGSGVIDYKFHCFNGSIKFIQVIGDRDFARHTRYQKFCDLDYNDIGAMFEDYPHFPYEVPAPIHFEEMKRLAKILCKGFSYVRVDFYEIEGKVLFGEMTFTSDSGYLPHKGTWTYEKDFAVGSFLKLPEPSSPPKLDSSVEYRIRQKFLSEIKFPSPPEMIPKRKIIASLTSWKKRIGTAHLAIQTILNQTRQPDLTVLYLATDEFPRREKDLPPELLALCSERFEIRWTKNIRSYKKLIPVLKDFPDEIIITFDDDLFFRPELIERLLVGYKKHPEMIQCHRITNISFDAAGNVHTSHIPFDRPTYLNKLSGGAACLYPPHSLHENVLREEKFMTLAPTSDDIWFWLMGVLNGRRVNVVENNIDKLDYIPGTQDVGLSLINDAGKRFFFQHLENILKAYPVLRDILYYEQRLANGE